MSDFWIKCVLFSLIASIIIQIAMFVIPLETTIYSVLSILAILSILGRTVGLVLLKSFADLSEMDYDFIYISLSALPYGIGSLATLAFLREHSVIKP